MAKKEIERKKDRSSAEMFKILYDVNTDNPTQEAKDTFAILMKDRASLATASHLGGQAYTAALRNMSAKSYLVREATEYRADEIKKEFGYVSSTIAEKLLIDEIVINWIKLQSVQNVHTAHTSAEHEQATGNYWDKRLTVAQNRFMKSIQTLTKVRKLIGATQAHAAKIYKRLMKEQEKGQK